MLARVVLLAPFMPFPWRNPEAAALALAVLYAAVQTAALLCIAGAWAMAGCALIAAGGLVLAWPRRR